MNIDEQLAHDNFDADIHSPNGKLTTHSLVMILTQPSSSRNDHDADTIERLSHSDVKLPIYDDEASLHYAGEKKPPMPELPEVHLPDEFKTHQCILNDRAAELDFQFMQDMNTLLNCPEYNGYNTKVCREQGHMLKKKTKIVYLPLIDKAPADPATIMSSFLKAQAVTGTTGQEYVIFMADQQLYRVALHVMWQNEDRFSNVYVRLGGMHLIMSYVGCIGSLMAGFGMTAILARPLPGY